MITRTKILTDGETRLLLRVLLDEHEESERAVEEADRRLADARKRWESTYGSER